MYSKKAEKKIKKNEKVKQLSNSLMKTLGLADKKGIALYAPEPLPTWKKRKKIVEKKLQK